jgi:hypothetical protein
MEKTCPAQQHYDGLNSNHRRELLLKIGETPDEARVLSQRDYGAPEGGKKPAQETPEAP